MGLLFPVLGQRSAAGDLCALRTSSRLSLVGLETAEWEPHLFHCLSKDTLVPKEEGGRKKTWDERRRCLAMLAIIIVIVGICDCLLLDCFSVASPDPGYPNKKHVFPLK